jgi:hypothetical protein
VKIMQALRKLVGGRKITLPEDQCDAPRPPSPEDREREQREQAWKRRNEARTRVEMDRRVAHIDRQMSIFRDREDR